jgi:dTDP-4-amino-4,6-dideoxygalactose transaminase
MQIPFFRYPHVFNQQRDEILAAMVRVMEGGAFILQNELKEFEQQIARFADARFAVGMGNGTDTLSLALRAAEVGRGDEVILASHTYIATAAAVHFTGANQLSAISFYEKSGAELVGTIEVHARTESRLFRYSIQDCHSADA